jgi:hypothetical protein
VPIFLPRLPHHSAVRDHMVVELGRIEVLSLHHADGAGDITVTRIRDTSQGGGELEQEGVAIAGLQRPTGAEDVG